MNELICGHHAMKINTLYGFCIHSLFMARLLFISSKVSMTDDDDNDDDNNLHP